LQGWWATAQAQLT